MRKEIKRYSSTAIISFTKQELKYYNLHVGDIIEFKPKIIKKSENESSICND